tara:strand:+ start:2340 stop:3323 length:984 start_codon:yes stop_codon:yes gene_type:complete
MIGSINEVTKPLFNTLAKWLSELKIGSNPSKTNNIVKELFWAVLETLTITEDRQTETEQLNNIISICNKTPHYEFSEGNIWEKLETHFKQHGCTESVSSKYTNFFRKVGELTPPGLNTSPRANCGKYELMWRLLRPSSVSAKCGDIEDPAAGGVLELKGKQGSIQDPCIRGDEYIKICNNAFKNSGFCGNKTKTAARRDQFVFEIEKKKHSNHYEEEFSKNIKGATECVADVLCQMGYYCPTDSIDIAKHIVGSDGKGYQERYKRILLKKMYEKYKTNKKFNRLIFFGDGTSLVIIENVDDLTKLQITDDYFRIGQPNPIGWYVDIK